MKTKIVYVVVSGKNDVYLEQAYVSMYSVKVHNPSAHISVVMDTLTETTLTDVRKKEMIYADDVVSVKIEGDYTKAQRSRILKTSVRKYIKGDFLFIDTDTIVVRSLDEIDNITDDISACQDTHSPFVTNPYRRMCLEHGRILGWPIEQEEVYFNSGIIYVKDSDIAHRFYENWNTNWLKGHERGVNMDQPAFAKTNYEMGHPVKILADVWNCELKHGMKYLKDTFVVHYLCTSISRNNDEKVFLLNNEKVFSDIVKNGGEIPESVKAVIHDPFYGLASVSLLLAGNDMRFFMSQEIKFLRNHEDTWCVRAIISYIRIIKRIVRLLNFILGKA